MLNVTDYISEHEEPFLYWLEPRPLYPEDSCGRLLGLKMVLLVAGGNYLSTRNYHPFIGSNRRFIDAFSVQPNGPH